MTECGVCSNQDLVTILNLGQQPLPNRFLLKSELILDEPFYDLNVLLCEKCGLVQLENKVSPKLMFENYLYIPSTSKTMMEHFENLSQKLINRFSLAKGDLVVDIGSNDGSFLKCVKKNNFSVLGIDPAHNLKKLSNKNGVNIISQYFTSDLASELIESGHIPAAITATNVMAHVNDLHDFCEGIRILLKNDGVFVSEVPYLVDLVEKNAFDTIYHEHLYYFSLRPIEILLQQHGLKIFDVEFISTHLGSVRIYVDKRDSARTQSPALQSLLKGEAKLHLNRRETYKQFSNNVIAKASALKLLIQNIKNEGKKIAAYGASAKGNVLLNYSGITNNDIDFIVDSIPLKQGHYAPGTHIPILSEDALQEKNPDYLLLLAWNYQDEIFQKQTNFHKNGGKWILPFPQIRII